MASSSARAAGPGVLPARAARFAVYSAPSSSAGTRPSSADPGTGARPRWARHSPRALAEGIWVLWPHPPPEVAKGEADRSRGGVTSSPDLSAVTSSVLQAESLPALRAAAYCAFECALQALRGAEDDAGPLLPAFVLAAAVAADGRDAVAADGSFRGLGAALPGNVRSLAAIDVADQVAGLSLALFTCLRDAAAGGGGPTCAAAAARAGRMHELLAAPG